MLLLRPWRQRAHFAWLRCAALRHTALHPRSHGGGGKEEEEEEEEEEEDTRNTRKLRAHKAAPQDCTTRLHASPRRLLTSSAQLTFFLFRADNH